MVIAADYDIGFDKGDEFIWNCNVFDEKKMEDIFGNDWNSLGSGLFNNIRENTQMKWEIEGIGKSEIINNQTGVKEEVFIINYKEWKWTNDNGKESEGDEKSQYAYVDPSNYEKDYIFPNFAPLWLPIPVGEYMKGLEKRLFNGYTVDGRVLLTITCELNKGDLDGKYPMQYIKILAMYNNIGILRSYKLYIKNHVVVIDISLISNYLAGIPAAIILSSLLIIGTIYVLFKKLN